MRQSTLSEYDATGVPCPACGERFDTPGGMKIHHYQIHGERIGTVTLVCEWCGAEYEEVDSRSERSSYCSKECKHEGHSLRMSGQANPSYENGKTRYSCDWCGDLVKKYASDTGERVFCSLSCRSAWRSKNRSGRDWPTWTGGRPLYEQVRRLMPGVWREVSKRCKQGKPCKLCGERTTERMAAHHIVPLMSGGANVDELLMPLCASCHPTVESYTKELFDPLLVP